MLSSGVICYHLGGRCYHLMLSWGICYHLECDCYLLGWVMLSSRSEILIILSSDGIWGYMLSSGIRVFSSGGLLLSSGR